MAGEHLSTKVGDEHKYAFDLIELKACCKRRPPAYQEPFFWEAETSPKQEDRAAESGAKDLDWADHASSSVATS